MRIGGMKLPAASFGVWTRFINLRLVIFGFAENDFESTTTGLAGGMRKAPQRG
jgi:hypothetical protein